MAVTDLRVVCKIIMCVSAFTFTELELEMAIMLIFYEIVKTAAKLLLQSGHAALQITQRMPLWALTIFFCDTIFHLRVTACREQGSHCND